jgi:class 3 adenylate cyclase
MASVLFTDIVGFSRNPLERQIMLLDHLQQIVRGTKEYQHAEKSGGLIKLPTGDGMALVFFHDPVAPVRCAIEIQNVLKEHPGLPLRTGIHTGPVFRQSDIKDNINVVGGGINIAQRVMDCGDAGHILVSRAVADVLEELLEWPRCIQDLGFFEVKHGVRLQIYNITRDGAGNPAPPSKMKAVQPVSPPTLTPAPPLPEPRRLLPIWAGLGVVVLAAGGWFAFNSTKAPDKAVQQVADKKGVQPVVAARGERPLLVRYYVEFARALKDNKFGPPMRFSGLAAEVDSGNGIRLVLSPAEQGYLYVLNQGAESTEEKPDVSIFFPSPRVRNGSARLMKDDQIRIPEREDAYLRFNSQKGIEKFWIVFSTEKIPELEKLKMYANENDLGAVKDPAEARAVPELLKKYPAEEEPKTDTANKLTELRSKGKVLVHLIEWQHY